MEDFSTLTGLGSESPSSLSPIRPAFRQGVLTPRDYQLRCVDAIYDAWTDYNSVLAVLATGLGKTVIAAEVALRWPDECGKVLFLAHREELIDQAREKIGLHTGELPDVEMGQRWASLDTGLVADSRVVVGSVQTLVKPKRRSRFKPEDFGLIVIDEAHHAAAKSYLTILEHFKQNPRHRILGITATPKRHDKVGMHNVFQHCCFEMDIRAGIDAGWLVGVQQKFITVEGLDFTLIRKTAGDLNMGDLAKAVMGGNAELTPAEREDLEKQEEMVHRFVDPTVREAQGRPTVVFCVTKEHARKSAEIFRRHPGITAEAVTDETPTDERKAIIGRFKGGHTQVLCGCTVFTEGFDAPETSVVAIFRPTKSEALYRQMIGRGTRPLSGLVDRYLDPADRREAISTSRKPSMTVLDFVGASGQHNLISSFDVLAGDSLPDDVKQAIQEAIRVGETVDVDEAISQATADREEEQRQAAENERRLREEEERRRREEAEAKKRADEEARRKQYEEAERLLRESERRRSQLLGHATYHKQDVDPFEGHGAPEQFQAKFRGGATDGQIGLLEKLGVKKEVAVRYSKEQAGVVITAMKARTGAEFRVTFGKYVGKALKEVPDSYVQWLKSQENPMDLAKRLISEWNRMKGNNA